MLVLTRRLGESIVIHGDIVVTVVDVGRNGQVRIGIEAPRHYQIYRQELLREIQAANHQALVAALPGSAAELMAGVIGMTTLAGAVVPVAARASVAVAVPTLDGREPPAAPHAGRPAGGPAPFPGQRPWH